MQIKIAKWYNNAVSPVIFMIDDFCNKWIDFNGNCAVDPGEDWGFARDSENSSFKFLKETFLKKYPGIKVTFFTPVGTRCPALNNSLCDGYSAPINEDSKSKSFFNNIHSNPKFEIAYHGLNHGMPGETAKDFRQEWITFNSVDEAIKQGLIDLNPRLK